jgi:hypothetical protein
MIEMHLLPFLVQKIQSSEGSISSTRKGIKNKFFRAFQPKERGENDGTAENFLMNKNELELRNLTDLAYVLQDYETCVLNCEYPISDFKKIKAYKNAAHSEEMLLFSKMATDRNIFRDWAGIEAQANQIYELYEKARNPS